MQTYTARRDLEGAQGEDDDLRHGCWLVMEGCCSRREEAEQSRGDEEREKRRDHQTGQGLSLNGATQYSSVIKKRKKKKKKKKLVFVEPAASGLQPVGTRLLVAIPKRYFHGRRHYLH
jgi:hypothetical protein